MIRTSFMKYYSRIHSLFSNIITKVQRIFTYIGFRGIQGILIEMYVKITKKPYVFTDMFGARIWLYPSDRIAFYIIRQSVTDASNVILFISRYVQKGWYCIDMGANIGAVSIKLWKCVGESGNVISIEADPSNCERIQQNFLLNKIEQGSVQNYAITDLDGCVKLKVYPDSNGWQTIGNPSFAKDHQFFIVDIPSIRFDTLFSPEKDKLIHLVKIDIEGAELLALEGMKNFLRDKKIQCLIFEVNYMTLEGLGYNIENLFEFWREFDYKLWKLEPDGSLADFEDWPDKYVGDCVAISK